MTPFGESVIIKEGKGGTAMEPIVDKARQERTFALFFSLQGAGRFMDIPEHL